MSCWSFTGIESSKIYLSLLFKETQIVYFGFTAGIVLQHLSYEQHTDLRQRTTDRKYPKTLYFPPITRRVEFKNC